MTSEAATLVLLVGDRLLRADFDAGSASPGSVLSAPRPRDGSLAESVRAALALNGKARRRVWVLADELWTQNVSLNRNQVTGLTEEQIGRALSFEIEPFSGIPVAESALGFRQAREANGTSNFWVVEIDRSDRDAIQRVVTEAGGRLEGIAHPGGLPHSLTNNGSIWHRFELWESSSFWITSTGDRVQAQVLNALPSRGTLPSTGTYELLGTKLSPTVPEAAVDLPWKRYTLNDDAPLQTWLRHWRASFAGKEITLPSVAPAALPPSPLKYLITALVLQIAVVLLCALHAFVAGREQAALTRDIAAHTAARQQLEGLASQTAVLRQQLASFQTATQQRARIEARRGSVAAVLRAIAAARPEDVVLHDILAESPSSMIVNGRALEASSVDQLSLALSEQLRSAGWSALPLQKVALRRLANSGPWQFSVRIANEDAAAATPPPRPPAKGGTR